MTVSRVIDESPRIGADTSRRVQVSISKRGYPENMVSFQVEGVLIAPVGDSSKPQDDSGGGARQLVAHLIDPGHRRIRMVTDGLEVSTSSDRPLRSSQ